MTVYWVAIFVGAGSNLLFGKLGGASATIQEAERERHGDRRSG